MASTPEKGDRVIATEDISTGFFSSVRKGTRGVVVDTSGFFSTTYRVRFEDGESTDCSESQIALA